LRQAGCIAEELVDILKVALPAGATPQLIWKTAADASEQIRHLKPQRSTLEEVFLSSLEQA
jgi:ABC-2 type transport system ATP-binding protein